MARIIIWSIEAQISRRDIFDYWNFRNKSKIYSRSLNKQFVKSLKLIANLSEIGLPTDLINVRIQIESHFQIIYSISETTIIVLDVWDTRQIPKNNPFK